MPTDEQLIALIEFLNSLQDDAVAEEWWLAEPDADEPNHEES
jgi:hypothetical protein